MSTALLRARAALVDAGLEHLRKPHRVAWASNEVWFADNYVLRVSPTVRARRLRREAALVAMLPDEVPYPAVAAAGATSMGEYLVLRRRPGLVLSRIWPSLNPRSRRLAVRHVAHILRHVHGVRGVDDHGVPLIEDPFAADTLECPHQLPPSRTAELLERCRALDHVDPGLVDEARSRLVAAASAFDRRPTTLVHGDLHFENLLWEAGRLTAVLDFEFARVGPPEIDLEVLLRFCANPALHVAAEYLDEVRLDDYREVPKWLREAYPDLFAHPRLADRLFAIALSFEVRALLAAPPTASAGNLPLAHALNRLRALLAGRSHVAMFDW